MLTSSHYWLSGLFAVSCATGALLQPSLTSAKPPQIFGEEALSETVDVSYRSDSSDHESLLSHRGSGRVRPSHLPSHL